MPVHRLNHAVFYVRDAARSAAFFIENLGFRRVAAYNAPGAAFLQAEGSTNDHDLALFSIGSDATVDRRTRHGRAVPLVVGSRHPWRPRAAPRPTAIDRLIGRRHKPRHHACAVRQGSGRPRVRAHLGAARGAAHRRGQAGHRTTRSATRHRPIRRRHHRRHRHLTPGARGLARTAQRAAALRRVASVASSAGKNSSTASSSCSTPRASASSRATSGYERTSSRSAHRSASPVLVTVQSS
jgi:catechol 2,3-dioxygenase-like lactoylglutathione lyase family enzyme